MQKTRLLPLPLACLLLFLLSYSRSSAAAISLQQQAQNRLNQRRNFVQQLTEKIREIQNGQLDSIESLPADLLECERNKEALLDRALNSSEDAEENSKEIDSKCLFLHFVQTLLLPNDATLFADNVVRNDVVSQRTNKERQLKIDLVQGGYLTQFQEFLLRGR